VVNIQRYPKIIEDFSDIGKLTIGVRITPGYINE
jgi:hypothetical protein